MGHSARESCEAVTLQSVWVRLCPSFPQTLLSPIPAQEDSLEGAEGLPLLLAETFVLVDKHKGAVGQECFLQEKSVSWGWNGSQQIGCVSAGQHQLVLILNGL